MDAAAVGRRRGRRRRRRVICAGGRAADRDRSDFARLRRRPARPRASARANETRDGLDLRAAVASGAAIGILGGLVGLILGSLRLPAMLRWVGEEPRRAVGTNLFIGIFVGAAGLVGHLPGGIDWTLLGVGAAGSVPGALLGSRLTGRLRTDVLLRVVGLILVAGGTAAILQGVL